LCPDSIMDIIRIMMLGWRCCYAYICLWLPCTLDVFGLAPGRAHQLSRNTRKSKSPQLGEQSYSCWAWKPGILNSDDDDDDICHLRCMQDAN
jgi:hypothetical protein